MFFKIFKYDIKNGIFRQYKRLILFFVLATIACVDGYFKLNTILNNNDLKITFGDLLFYVFRGMEKYIPSPERPFIFPALWMLIFCGVVYSNLYYPFNDLMGYGKQILINSKSKRYWWLSKCLWVLVYSSLIFLLILLSILLFCILFRLEINLSVTQEIISYYVPMFAGFKYPVELSIELLFLPAIVASTFCMFQLLMSLIIKPLYSFLIIVASLLFSTYYVNTFFIGNYGMVQRSNKLLEDGVNTNIGLIICLSIIIFVCIFGGFVFQKYDIINRE